MIKQLLHTIIISSLLVNGIILYPFISEGPGFQTKTELPDFSSYSANQLPNFELYNISNDKTFEFSLNCKPFRALQPGERYFAKVEPKNDTILIINPSKTDNYFSYIIPKKKQIFLQVGGKDILETQQLKKYSRFIGSYYKTESGLTANSPVKIHEIQLQINPDLGNNKTHISAIGKKLNPDSIIPRCAFILH